ncbi:hypothetical protein FRC12_018823 [Ceratobasidium sp. 428]|nr:hypothetical protein FRC12_018823 [Ceratobasidium sp. 428]
MRCLGCVNCSSTNAQVHWGVLQSLLKPPDNSKSLVSIGVLHSLGSFVLHDTLPTWT